MELVKPTLKLHYGWTAYNIGMKSTHWCNRHYSCTTEWNQFTNIRNDVVILDITTLRFSQKTKLDFHSVAAGRQSDFSGAILDANDSVVAFQSRRQACYFPQQVLQRRGIVRHVGLTAPNYNIRDWIPVLPEPHSDARPFSGQGESGTLVTTNVNAMPVNDPSNRVNAIGLIVGLLTLPTETHGIRIFSMVEPLNHILNELRRLPQYSHIRIMPADWSSYAVCRKVWRIAFVSIFNCWKVKNINFTDVFERKNTQHTRMTFFMLCQSILTK